MDHIAPQALSRVLAAIIMVESAGDKLAVNEKENAVGLLQIRPIMVEDVNRILQKQAYTLEDRTDPNKSVEMFWVYQKHYTRVERIGRIVTLEDIACNWNSGPNGYRKSCTAKYWDKVKTEMDKGKDAVTP